MTRPYDEVSLVIGGVVEVEDPGGGIHRAGPGDVVVTPRGSEGIWRCIGDVVKFWMIAETDTERPGTTVVAAGDPPAWQDVPRPPGDTAPPGREVVLFRTADRRAACGFWRRVPETGRMEPLSHEVALILEGEVEVTEDGGEMHRVGPGDVLVTPAGTRATWKSLSPVRKFWAIDHGAAP
jgi:uncharacterized cupin superfamily protein